MRHMSSPLPRSLTPPPRQTTRATKTMRLRPLLLHPPNMARNKRPKPTKVLCIFHTLFWGYSIIWIILKECIDIFPCLMSYKYIYNLHSPPFWNICSTELVMMHNLWSHKALPMFEIVFFVIFFWWPVVWTGRWHVSVFVQRTLRWSSRSCRPVWVDLCCQIQMWSVSSRCSETRVPTLWTTGIRLED